MDTVTCEISVAAENVPVELHAYPHLEEVAALVAVEEYGDRAFLDKYCPDGRLWLGVGGGPFDEHPDPDTGEGRKKGCCLALVAKALNLVEKAPWWRQMVAFCNFAETGGQMNPGRREAVEARHPYDVYSLTRLLFRWRRHLAEASGGTFTEPEQHRVIEHLKDLVRMFVWDQEVFHRAAQLIRRQGRHETINGPKGKELRLVVVAVPADEDHNWHVSTAARAWFKADVVVQQDPDGHIHVFTNNKANLNLDDLAQAVNIAEQEAQDDVRERDWEKLRGEGVPYREGRWYYAKPYGQLHNGTEHFEYPVTRLSLETVASLVKMSLDTSFLGQRTKDECQKACRGGDCRLHKYGFQRCRRVRYEQKLRRV